MENATTPTPTTASVEVSTNSLRWALDAVLRAVCTLPERASLYNVRAEYSAPDAAPGILTLVATDGHRLHRADIYAPGAPWLSRPGVTWSADNLRAVLKALPKGKKAPPTVTLRPGVGTAVLEVLLPGCVLEVSTLDEVVTGRFPDWRQVTTDPVPDPTGAAVGLDPAYLADACAASPAGTTLRLTHGDPLSPVHLHAEDPDLGKFHAVIMVMRI